MKYKSFEIIIRTQSDGLISWRVQRLDGTTYEEGTGDSAEEAEQEAKDCIDEFYR